MHNKQVAILNLLSSKGDTARLRDLRSLPGLQHSQVLKYHIGILQQQGLVTFNPTTKEVGRVLKTKRATTNLFLSIPVFGQATAGPASIFNEDKITGYLQITENVLNHKARSAKKRLVALQVNGESMNKAHIADNRLPAQNGDYVLVDPADNGLRDKKYVVVSVDGMPVIKKFVNNPSAGYAMLVSESSQHFQPILLTEDDNAIVSGSVLQVIPSPFAALA